jgi:hypothetical protein
MTDYDPPVDPILEPLLERGRIIPPVPDFVRARSLARARAIMAAAAALPPEPMPVARRFGLLVALAASIALVVGAAGAVAALRGRAPQGLVPVAPLRPAVVPPVRAPTLASPPTPGFGKAEGS